MRDRDNVQAAFDAAPPGGTVVFAGGSYLVGGEGLVLRSPGVSLVGDAGGTTLLGCTRDQRMHLSVDGFFHACGDGLVLAAEAQRVSGLRFESFGLALSIREATEIEERGRSASFIGGHVVENNSFNDGFSLQILLDADSTVRVRRNVFRNVWHAVAIGGRNVDVTHNDISVPHPERVPFGYAGVAIGIRPLRDDGACGSMVVEGNRLEGHTEAVAVAVFPQDPPGAECSEITIRDNDIVMRPVRMPEGDEQAGRLAIAPAIRLFNAQPLVSEGLMTWPEHWMPEGGWPEAMSGGRISHVRIEGNRITGAVGVGIEAARVTDSRIVDNEIDVRPATTREELDGLTVGGNAAPGVWVVLGLVDEVNGKPVWVSPGSERTIVRPPRWRLTEPYGVELTDAILGLTRGLAEAWTHLDADAYLGYFSDDLVFYFQGRQVSRPQFEAAVRGSLAALRESTFDIVDPEVELLGADAAAVSFFLRERMVDHQGAVTDLRAVLTLVWERRGGHWVVVRAHESLSGGD